MTRHGTFRTRNRAPSMNEFSARCRPFQRWRRQKSIRAKKSRSRHRSLGGRRCLSERGTPQRGRRRRSQFLSKFLGLFCGFQKAEKSDKSGAGDTCLEKNPKASERMSCDGQKFSCLDIRRVRRISLEPGENISTLEGNFIEAF